MADSGALNSAIQLTDLVIKVLPYALGLFLIGFTWWRTGTVFFPLYRLYQLVGGRKSFHSDRIERHWQAYEDLNNINLWFGLRLRSSRAMHEFIAWLDKHKVTLEEAARCRPYFDANQRKVNLPTQARRRVAFSSLASVMVVLLIAATILMLQDKALLKVNKTHTWLWVASGEAYGVSYPLMKWISATGSWHLDSSQCLFEDNAVPLADQWDKDVICRLVLGNEPDYVNDAVASQHKLAGVFYGAFWVIAFCIVYFAQRIINAKGLVARLADGGGEMAR